MFDKDGIIKQNSAIREALIRIEAAYSKKNKGESFEELLKKSQDKNMMASDIILPWQQEVLGALSTLYNAGHLDSANYIDNLR